MKSAGTIPASWHSSPIAVVDFGEAVLSLGPQCQQSSIESSDSVSKVMDERTREARLKLIGSQFDRNAQYTLVLENAEMRTRYSQYAVTIDLAFQDDFF
uniref:hypothetical protein n=1 Tax=Vibrio cholerae TaxID=666 RepID=UPI003F5877D1